MSRLGASAVSGLVSHTAMRFVGIADVSCPAEQVVISIEKYINANSSEAVIVSFGTELLESVSLCV